MSPAPRLSRRSFLVVAAGGVVAVTLPSCVGGSSKEAPAAASDTTAPGGGAAAQRGGAESAPRALVLVELDGGNDGLSALVPADGRYRDARPTIAVPEGDIVALSGTTEVGLHPALAS